MRTAEPGELWPDHLVVPAAELTVARARGVVRRAQAFARRLVITDPLSFGERAPAVLRLLTDATARRVPLEWTLGGEPPWPVRTLVHLTPPAGRGEYARRWRDGHRAGLCCYRVGPGFVRVRDLRPDGEHRDVLITGALANRFVALAEDAAADEALLADLVDTGLAVRVDEGHHVLPHRLLRWPIPHTEI
ncbi:hypothetical protein EV193_1011037 [Herbihabitans rhizosphaerae]|uniref:Uncharacterized protein n=1 Tax=Herbihabitans rhizosphaerae TaxID=1872711 RepID=A0A4Q7L897_9PSEU|nr:DUF5825 family protein [Herbihabitans rhizosphaerae]RZS45150.1 hypothetical protein EV193_1011037 [Herbihabitans rhizosphaerae]